MHGNSRGGWGRGWGGALVMPGSSRGGSSGAIGLQQFDSGALQLPQQGEQQFAGFDVSEEGQRVFVLDGDGRGGQEPQQQPQPWVGTMAAQRSQQPSGGGAAAVELQQQQQDAAAGGSGSVVSAMRHVGEVWGVFDRTVMQPVFGGPEAARGSSQGGGSGSSRSPPPNQHPL